MSCRGAACCAPTQEVMSIRYNLQIAIAIKFAVILFLCAALRESDAAERPRERVRIGVSSKSIGFFDIWVAHEKGFFRKYGFDSEVITMRPNLSVVAVQAGEIDYTMMTSTAIRSAVKGLPLKLVTIGLKSSFHALVGRESFKSAAELKGKKIAISNVGATDDLVARAILQKAGLDPRRDVAMMSVGASETRFQSLISGQMDAATLSLPHSVLAKQQGFRFLGTAGDVLHVPFTGLSTSTAKIQRDREAIKRMIQAQMESMRWIKNQKSDAIQFLRQFFGTDESTAVESYNVYAPLIIDDVRVTAEAVRAILDSEGATNILWTQVADASLVEEVLQKGR
ncbi:MAG: ABC transporter substrate-binding protein [Deltaproteobacteria bacterium]|nr:ABC transporter substrate-binding protein [Deltaproteobacteria bacterium]